MPNPERPLGVIEIFKKALKDASKKANIKDIVLVGESRPKKLKLEPEVEGAKTDLKKRVEEPVLTNEQLLKLLTAEGSRVNPNKMIVTEATRVNNLFEKVAFKHLTPDLEEYLARRILEGASLADIGLELKQELYRPSGKVFKDFTSRSAAQRIVLGLHGETDNPAFAIAQPGGAPDQFKIYTSGDLPEVEDPGNEPTNDDTDESRKKIDEYREKKRRQAQRERLLKDIEETYQVDVEDAGVGDEFRQLGQTLRELRKGTKSRFDTVTKKTFPPRYNKEDVEAVAKKIRVRREELNEQRRKEYEERQERIRRERAAEQVKRDEVKEREKAERDAKEKLREVKESQREEEYRLKQLKMEEQEADRERQHSTMWLDLVTREAMASDPKSAEDAVEKQLMHFYKPVTFPESRIYETTLDNMIAYLESGEFAYRVEKHIRQDAKSNSITSGVELTPEQLYEKIDKELAQREKQADQLKEKITNYKGIKIAAAQIELGTGLDKMAQSMANVGDRAWNFLMSDRGGMNKLAYDIYLDELANARFDGNGKRRISGEQLDLARGLATKRIYRDRALYKELLGRDVTEKDAEHYIRVAHSLARIRIQTTLAILRGLGPAEFGGISSYADSSSDESIAAALDFIRFNTEKWGNLNSGQQEMFEGGFVFAAIDQGYLPVVEEEIARMKRDGTYKAKRKEMLEKRWEKGYAKYIRLAYPRRALGWGGVMDEDKEFKRLLLAERGKPVMGEMFEMYDIDSSGWRIELRLQQASALWKNSETIGLGYWLRRAGIAYIPAKGHEQHKVFWDGSDKEPKNRADRHIDADWGSGNLSVGKALTKIGEYIPQQLGVWYFEQKDQVFSGWFASAEIQAEAAALLGHQPSTYMDVNSFIHERYLAVNEFISRAGIKNIDYSKGMAGLSEDQKRVLEKILSGAINGKTTSLESYMGFVHKLSGFVNQKSQLEKFIDPRYRTYLTRTQFTYDSRLGLMETPGVLTGSEVKDTAKERLPLSHYEVDEGVGRRDETTRFWGDLPLAMELVNLIREGMTPDQKKFTELLQKVHKNIEIYSGGGNATKAVLYLDAGWIRTAMTDPGIMEQFFLGTLSNSSIQKRLFGDEGLSIDLNKADEILDKQHFIFSKFAEFPEMRETYELLEKYLGISEVELFGNENLKIHWNGAQIGLASFRNRVLMATVLALIALEAANVGNKALDASGGSSKHATG